MRRARNCVVAPLPEINSCRRRLRSAPAVFLAAAVLASLCHADKVTPRVAVLELRVAVGGAPADLGIAAARVIGGAYESTGKFEALPAEDVESAVKAQGLTPPFGVGHIQLLAAKLKADLVVHGSVRGLTYDRAAGSASIILAVEVVDGKTGVLKSRKEATGVHTAQVGMSTSEQDLIPAALSRAAESAVEQLTGVEVNAPEEALGAPGEAPMVASLAPARVPDIGPAAGAPPRMGEPRGDLKASPPGVAAGPLAGMGTSQGPLSDTPGRLTVGEGAGTQKPSGVATTGGPDPDKPEVRDPALRDPPPVRDPEPLLKAKILVKLEKDKALVTLGRPMPVTKNMELEVYRVNVDRDGESTKQRLGLIRIIKVNATDAIARILEGRDAMRTGDYAYFYGE